MKNWIKTHSKLLVLCSIGGLGGFLIILVAIFTVLFFSNNRCSDNAVHQIQTFHQVLQDLGQHKGLKRIKMLKQLLISG